MKIYDLLEIQEGLNKITNLETSVPVSQGYKLVRNKKMIQKELETYEEMRNAIVSKYADKDGEVKKDNPNFNKCFQEVRELANQEVDNIEFKKIKLSDIESLNLPMNLITAIDMMIEEE